MLGVDCSKYQTVDFSKLKTDFFLMKATEGTGYTDPKFTSFQTACHQNNIPLGYYHFARPDLNSAVNEADWFCSVIKPLNGELICLDYEQMAYADPVGWSLAFVNRVHEKLGVWPLVYLNQSLAHGHDWSSVSKNCGLWLAQYDNISTSATPQPGWNIAMKQYTSTGSIMGIAGNVDCNVFFGDLNVFKKYGYQGQNGGTVSNIYKGLDLTNQDSMKVAVDVWDAVINLHQYIKLSDLNIPGVTDTPSLTQYIAGLKSRATDLSNQVGTLSGQVSNLTDQVNNLTSESTTCETNLKTVTDQLNTAKANFSQLSTDKADLVNQLAVLQAKYDTLAAGGTAPITHPTWAQIFDLIRSKLFNNN
jgi:GH25 family lysozyme M1 (1,4-beta-N-acetylmuramidase)